MLSLHRIRSLLVKFRTMQVNQLRGLLYEFGASFRAGRVGGLAEIRSRMAELEAALPIALMCCLQDQLKRIDGLQTEIDQLEHRIGACQKQDAACRASPTCRASVASPRRRWWRPWAMLQRSSPAANLLRSSDSCLVRAAPEARSAWEPSPSEAIPTCVRC